MPSDVAEFCIIRRRRLSPCAALTALLRPDSPKMTSKTFEDSSTRARPRTTSPLQNSRQKKNVRTSLPPHFLSLLIRIPTLGQTRSMHARSRNNGLTPLEVGVGPLGGQLKPTLVRGRCSTASSLAFSSPFSRSSSSERPSLRRFGTADMLLRHRRAPCSRTHSLLLSNRG